MPEFDRVSGGAPASGAVTEDAWTFARVEALWSRFAPMTPYGKEAKERRLVLGDRPAIESLYDATQVALALIDSAEGPTLDRLTHHLKRLPRLPIDRATAAGGPDALPAAKDGGRGGSIESSGDFDLVELFQVKKFLSNYRVILSLIDEPTKRAFGLGFGSTELAARLDLGGSDPETFFIADAYHPSLREIRSRIAALDEALALGRGRIIDAARRLHALDFAGRDFLIVGNEEALALVASCDDRTGVGAEESGARPSYVVETYDSRSCIVRLQDDERTLRLEQERSLLAARELEAEEAAIASLSAEVSSESRALRGYADAICAFDMAFARARLAREHALVRPGLGSESFALRQGRFLPCAWDCEELGLRYTPLDLEVAERVAVVFGSNMGGKTVALQTALFFQILAQTGLFVPAAGFATSVHPRIVYVGESADRRREARFGEDRLGEARLRLDEGRGLSGFGFEILGFTEAVGPSGAEFSEAFIAFDEFARTTSSREAEALLSAAIESLSRSKRGRNLFSTHFHGLRRLAGVRFLRMRGLDRPAAREAIVTDEPLTDRIRKINGMMRYEIIDENDEAAAGSDAIAIASLLGLDAMVVRRAESIYEMGE